MELDGLFEIYFCVSERWSPGIGDPTVMGWLTVAAYGLCSLACFAAAGVRPLDRRFWALLFVMLLLLGVNKQFDLQSGLTAIGRCLSQFQGWYDERRHVQFWFIVSLLVISSVVFLLVLVRMVGRLRNVGIALFGFGVLLTFVSVRAVGFHHFDQVIGMTIGGTRVNWLLELSGILLIALNALAVVIARAKPVRTN